MFVRAQMENLLGQLDAEAVLLDEATPSLIKHCVRKVAKKYGGDTQRAFAICVASMQKGGYLEPGTMKLTAKGKAQSSQHAQEPDAEKKLKGYERLLKKAKKSEKDLRAEALKMIAATEAKKKLKKKLKKESVEPECLTCEAADKPCPECKESGGLVYEDACDCWKCEVCGWQGANAPATEAKGERMSFEADGKQFEIRWSDKKHRFVVVVTDEDWDYEDEADAADMSSEIRGAKSLDDAAEILGVNESVEESKKTYAQAQADIMAGLQKDGWTLKQGLKVPQALSPDSSYKLFFKAQAIYLAKGDSDLGGARSLHLGDIRGSTYEQFKAALARWTTEETMKPRVDVAEMRRLAGLDETFKVGTTRQRADGAYKKQASGDWEKVMSGGSTPTSAAGAIQATFGKYGPGKLSKMSADDKDHVVRALATVDWKTLLHDTDQNARLVQMMKAKKPAGYEAQVKDLEHMNKLYFAAMKKKNPPTKTSALPSAEAVEMRRLSGIDKYPDRVPVSSETGRAFMADRQMREFAGIAGAHGDWTLGEAMKLGEKERKQITLFLKRQGWGGEDFWFTDEIGRGGAAVKLNVDSGVAAEIADELNSLGEFGTAKVVGGGGSDKQIVFGEATEALWRSDE